MAGKRTKATRKRREGTYRKTTATGGKEATRRIQATATKGKRGRRKEDEQKSLELEAELCRRRQQLDNYKFGDKIKLDSFLGLEIDDVTQLRNGVFGPAESGKSCYTEHS